MTIVRFVLCALAALVLGALTFYVIGKSGLTEEGGLAGGIYSNLVTYPSVVLMGCFGFWIAFAATDPGSEK